MQTIWQEQKAKGHGPARPAVMLVALAGLLLRVAWALSLGDQVIWLDEGNYHRLALNLVQGNGLSLDGQSPTASRPPGYPTFMSVVYGLCGPRLRNVRIAQAFLWAFATVVAYGLARELGLGQRAAAITLALVAFYPYYVYLSGTLYPASLFTLTLLLSTYGLLKVYHGGGRAAQAATGVAMGLSLLVVPYVGTVFLFIPFWLMTSPRWKEPYQRWACLLVLLGTAGIVYSPWVVRNYLQFRTLIPSHTHGGTAFWAGNTEPAEVTREVWVQYPPSLQNQLRSAASELEADRLMWQAARAYIRNNPRQYAVKTVQRALHFYALTPYTVQNNPHARSWASQYIPMLSYGPILLLSAVGLVMLRRHWRYWMLFSWYFLAFTLVCALVVSRVRYRLPLDLYLILLASVPLARAWEYINRWRAHEKA